ncbi:MAG: hypothetical protein R2737_09585 [Candidatus Nanopelagicales bacterium]
MATVEECRAAIEELARRLEPHGPQVRAHNLPDRTLGCTLLDLDVTFWGTLTDGALVDITDAPGPKPQIRLVMDSDDLIALTDGSLKFSHAWATGQVRLDASLRDLLRMRSLLAASAPSSPA